jgi:putative FmdB family regulatory protein
MPIHEYVCTACGHAFEELVRTANQRVACPKCGAAKLTRKMSSFAAVVGSSGECDQAEACPRSSCCSGGACPHSH